MNLHELAHLTLEQSSGIRFRIKHMEDMRLIFSFHNRHLFNSLSSQQLCIHNSSFLQEIQASNIDSNNGEFAPFINRNVLLLNVTAIVIPVRTFRYA
ncbi:hypothetical protein LINGRAHAP2_LOCUS11973 [Linum grandiflorum]